MGARFAYYLLILPISYLPLPVIYFFTDLLFLVFISIFPYRSKVITGNLERSFPDKNAQEIKKLRRLFYRHFTDLLAEGIKNMTISEKALRRRFKVKNPEVMDALFQKKKNILLISGHYNNWEWLVTAQNLLFPHRAYGIGQVMRSAFWDQKINERRQRFGMRVVHSKNYKEALQRNPDELKAVLVLSDQSPGKTNRSYWMDFLNQPTAVLFGAETMANELNYACVFFILRKPKRGFYEMELTLISENPAELKWGELTERHVRLLEDEIRRVPQYWLWSHKRWKRELPADINQLRKEQHEAYNKRFNK